MSASGMKFRLQEAVSRVVFCGFLAISIAVGASGANAQGREKHPITQSDYLDQHLEVTLKKYRGDGRPEATIIADVVIDPDRLFVSFPWYWEQLRSDKSKFYRTDLDLSLKYLGDDYDFPVMGLALIKITEENGQTREKVKDFWIARAVRSPLSADSFDRPRNRGRYAVHLYETLREENPKMPAREIISTIPFEYLETNSLQCPHLDEVIAQLFDVSFVPSKLDYYPLHADSIELTVRAGFGYRTSKYKGWVEEAADAPGGWALSFTNSISNCWHNVPMEQFDKFEIPE